MTDYHTIFSPSNRDKPRFMALAAAILSQVDDLLSLVTSDYLSAFDLSTAVGAQLDALGVLLDTPRPSASTIDEDYRFLLRARIAAHHWDGTNGTIPAMLAAAFPGLNAQMIDNEDGTVSVRYDGSLPFPAEDLFPVPAGIQMIEGNPQ